MFSSILDALLKLSKASSPQKMFDVVINKEVILIKKYIFLKTPVADNIK